LKTEEGKGHKDRMKKMEQNRSWSQFAVSLLSTLYQVAWQLNLFN
jgi:hypothetical protein